MFTNITVAEVKLNGTTGFSVTALYRPPFEDMFERITHPAVFEDFHRANRLCDKVRASLDKVNFSNWILPTCITSSIQNDVNPPRFLVASRIK